MSVTRDTNFGVAGFNEWVYVVGWAAWYRADVGWSGWIRSSNPQWYRVGTINPGTVLYPGLAVVGGMTGPGSQITMQWGGSNSFAVSRYMSTLMGISVYTDRTGWFFRYVRPVGTGGIAEIHGDFCYFP